jgi:hypothetical protein
VFIGFVFLLISIVSGPIDFFLSWPGMLGLRLLISGSGLVVVATALSLRERTFVQEVTRPALFCVAIPAIWMIVQTLPVAPFAHPFWESAANALHHPVAGSISIDIGATILAISHLSLAVVVTLLCTAISIDRTRAEWVLIALTITTSLISVSSLCGQLVPTWFGTATNIEVKDEIFAYASLGLMLGVTTGYLFFERFETRRTRQKHALSKLIFQEGACTFALVTSGLVVLQSRDHQVLFVAIAGLSVLLTVILIRRIGLGALTGGAIVVTLIIIGTVVASTGHLRAADLLFAYSTAPDASIELARRMLEDAPWAGTGAGTFGSLRPLYQTFEDAGNIAIPSSAAALSIELGRTLFWLTIGLALVLFVVLLRCTLKRGRDSIYAAAGASSLMLMMLGSFINAGLLATPVWLCVSAILGLALAQSKSRSS